MVGKVPVPLAILTVDKNCYFITPKCSYKISAGSKFVFAATRDEAASLFLCSWSNFSLKPSRLRVSRTRLRGWVESLDETHPRGRVQALRAKRRGQTKFDRHIKKVTRLHPESSSKDKTSLPRAYFIGALRCDEIIFRNLRVLSPVQFIFRLDNYAAFIL